MKHQRFGHGGMNNSTPQIERFEHGNHVWLVDAASLSMDGSEMTQWLADVANNAQRTPAGRGSAWFVPAPNGEAAVLRHARRGGLFGKLVRDLYRYAGETSVRTFAEFRLLVTMRVSGLPVPKVLAAHYQRSGFVYTADLLTQQLPNVYSLAEALESPLPEDAWRALGSTLARFHRLNICHADLNAHNVLLDMDEPSTAYLIDFDKSDIRPHRVRWLAGQLGRLHRSLNKLGLMARADVQQGWQVLTEAHAEAMKDAAKGVGHV